MQTLSRNAFLVILRKKLVFPVLEKERKHFSKQTERDQISGPVDVVVIKDYNEVYCWEIMM